MKFAVGLSGLRGSGKTSLAELLSSSYGFSNTSFGEVVRQEAAIRGLPSNVETLQELGLTLIAEWQWPLLCDRVFAGVPPNSDVVVDGVRHVDVLEVLRARASPRRFVLVYVDTSPERRKAQLSLREGEGGLQRDSHVIESEASALREVADMVVTGDSHYRSAEVIRYLKSIDASWMPVLTP